MSAIVLSPLWYDLTVKVVYTILFANAAIVNVSVDLVLGDIGPATSQWLEWVLLLYVCMSVYMYGCMHLLQSYLPSEYCFMRANRVTIQATIV